MVAEQIEKLKREYTDKYVVVNAARPELARFRDAVGRVKTVNMSGRALVEFMDYHLNIGWYDIDPAFLKVVDKPAPKVEKPKAEKKAAAKVEPKPEAAPVAKTQAAAKPKSVAAVAGKMSVAEMLAAARAAKGGAAAPAKPAEVKAKAAAKPRAAKSAPGAKMSVAEMLAAARAGKGGAAPEAKPQAEVAAVEVEVAREPVAKPQAAAAPVGEVTSARYKVDRTKMSVAEMIAYCRKVDKRG